MCQFFAVTPFSFFLTEPHKRNYVNQINPCKTLQPLGVCCIDEEKGASEVLLTLEIMTIKRCLSMYTTLGYEILALTSMHTGFY